MIKIGFSGTPFCGKSSLINEVQKILGLKYRLMDVEDVRRSIPFDDDQTKSFPVQFYALSTQINRENLKREEAPDILLCDRSVLDHWVFWKHFTDNLEKNLELEEKERLLFYLYRFWISTYDLIVWVRREPKAVIEQLEKDQFELPEIEELKQFEDRFGQIIGEGGLAVLEVWNQLTIDECAQQIVKGISERLLCD